MAERGVWKYLAGLTLILLLTFTPTKGVGQIIINELVSSNSAYLDEDGDSPDWIELFNTGSAAVDLTGWSLTDDINRPDKWLFPSITIGPGEYLLIWASGKDRVSIGFPRTLVNPWDEFRYLVPNQAVDPSRISLGFDDSAWSLGNGGFGYGDGDDQTIIPTGSPSVMIRKSFNLSDTSLIQELIFDVDYDDSFVAYLNGLEIARSNVYGDPPDWNSLANAGREAFLYQGGTVERYHIPDWQNILVEGENLLFVEGHNVSTSSSDMSLIPFLSVISSQPLTEGTDPHPLLQLSDRYLHTNFNLSSGGETIALYDNLGALVDQVDFPEVAPDLSYGFHPVSSQYLIFETPTPGEINSGNTYAGQVLSEVTFSHPGGVTNINSVTLGGNLPTEVIRYTLDGTVPDANSTMYSGPISISATTMIRAAIFRDGYFPSKAETRTYIRGSTIHDLPVVSLVTEPENFFDPVDGIYVLGEGYSGNFPYFGSNIWEDWERPIHFSIYENGTLGTAFNAGTKIFGGWSRAQPQRSLSIFARGKYGEPELNYQLFPDYPYSSFQALVLRNSGNDFLNTNIRDGVLTSLMKTADLEIQAFRPVATYLNGEYWGMYNLREKVNEHFISSKQNVDPNSVDLLETNANIIHGSNEEYLQMIQFIQQNPVSIPQNYDYVASLIDIDNFITYQLAQIYFDNTDWPGNNNKFWKSTGGKWRWILFDTDFGFGIWNPGNFNNNTLSFALEPNGPGWPNPPWSTYLFRQLITNQTFRNRFVNLFADNLNTRFLPQKVSNHIDSIATRVQPEIVRHFSRWGGDYQNWLVQVENMKSFGNQRPNAVRNHIRGQFGLSTTHTVFLVNETPTYGYIQLNSLRVQSENWSGGYFQGVPIELTAVPAPGYTFTNWSGDINSTEPSIVVNLTEDVIIQANFIEGNLEGAPLVINEINYNSSNLRNSGDWVEIYNPNNSPADLSGYELRDDDDTHKYFFPGGSSIPGKGYLVVARSVADFQPQYPSVNNVIGDMGFGLSSTGDAVRLFNALGELEDAVYYLSSIPWPPEADGQGWTLELINPFLDNANPSNWASINSFGSPGRPNSVVSSVEESFSKVEISAYPNPATNQLNMEINLPESSTAAEVKLYNLTGLLVRDIYSGSVNPGTTRLVENIGTLPHGVYLLRYSDTSGHTETIKIIRN